jgi:hypothetical protein
VPQLGIGWRIFFVASGWILVLIGLAGLALPGIQGVLTIVLGGALLSLASESAYWALRWAFRRWPRGWRKMVRMRRRIYAWLGTEGAAKADEEGLEEPPRNLAEVGAATDVEPSARPPGGGPWIT